jgi:hypothetical protein
VSSPKSRRVSSKLTEVVASEAWTRASTTTAKLDVALAGASNAFRDRRKLSAPEQTGIGSGIKGGGAGE